MKYSESEKQALELFGKENFRNVTKDDVVGYISMIKNLEPEVAKKVLEQYPELVKLIHEKLVGYNETIEKSIESSDKTSEQCFEIYKKVLSDLSKCLDKDDLSEEERKEIREQEMEIARMADRKDLDNKNFNWKMVSAASFVVVTVIGVGAGVLGGKFNIKLPKNN